MSEAVLVELYPYDSVSETVKKICFAKGIPSTKISGSSDPYHPRVNGNFAHEIGVYEGDTPSGIKLSIGTVAINNADGKFNFLFGYQWGARQIKIYRGDFPCAFSDFELVFDGSVLAISADRTDIQFSLSEKSSLIPEVLQKNAYTGTGGAGGFLDLRGAPKPLCFGLCKNISPVLIDPVKQVYQVHDGTIEGILGVYDGGVPLTKGSSYANLAALVNDANKPNDGSFSYTLSGYFRLGAQPAKFINADVQGQFYSKVNLADTVKAILLDRTDLTSSDLDLTSFSNHATLYPGRISGLYYKSLDIGFVEWLENTVASLDSFWYFSPLGKLVIKPFKFGTPVSTIQDRSLNNFRKEGSSRPLKEVKVLYDRNSDIIPVNEFPLVVQDLNLYVENTVIRVSTYASGNGGTYSYTGTIQAVLNGEAVSDLGAVVFYCAAEWISISPDGTFTISDPGTAVAYAEVRANYAEYTAQVTLKLEKSMGAYPFKDLVLSTTDHIFDYSQNGFPLNDAESTTITATRTNVTGTLVWAAEDNLGQDVALTGTGDSRSFTAASVTNGPMTAYVKITATAPDGTYNETRVILSRGSTGYFNPLSDLLTLADSKVAVFYSDSPPTTGVSEGDLWFDTNDQNKLYRRISSTWVFINDARIAEALTAAATAQDTADGKITLFNQTTTPTAEATGDVWYNPDNKEMKSWNGSTWVIVSDITAWKTANAIINQGALATKNSADWRTQILARPAINELYYDFNYTGIAGTGGFVEAGWAQVPSGQTSIISVSNSPGGKALVVGDGTTSTSVFLYGPEWVPYNSGDLYEIAFDIEVISAVDASTTYYLGVEAKDKADNTLGNSHNYVAASGVSQNAAVGTRFITKGYLTGFTSASSSGQHNSPLTPGGLPDGTAASFGQGGAVKFRPLVIANYNGKRGTIRVHAIRITRIPARLAAQDEVSFGAVTLKESAGGSTATLTNFKTSLGTAAGILSQGALATLNNVDWQSKVVGVGKPANNAGTANILIPFGSYSTVTANTVAKSGGTHGAFEGGAYGAPYKSSVFISSSVVIYPTWWTHLSLDPVSASNTNMSATGVWLLRFKSNSTDRSLELYKNGSLVGSWTVAGVATANDRIAIICNGVRVFAALNGVFYGGDTSAYNATADATYWPKVMDFYNTGESGHSIYDIQYGAWTDVRVFLGDGITAIAQSAYKTDEGVASGITGQGSLATKNNVDLGSGDVVPNGGIPPTVPDNGFTYTSTTSSVTISWASMTVYRADGTTISIASGSQSCTGLSSSYSYKFYPYIVDTGGSSATIAFATNQGAVSYGSPKIAYVTSGSVAAKAYVSQLGRIDMGSFNAATTSGGTGGGGGGGWNCLHQDTLVDDVLARHLRPGSVIKAPDGEAVVEEVIHRKCSRWIRLYSEEDLIGIFTEGHIFYSAVNDEPVCASSLRLGHIIKAKDSHVIITGMHLDTETATAVGIRISDPHLHFAGELNVLCHNGTQKP